MATVQVEPDLPALVSAAAEITCKNLMAAVEAYGQACWVMAGGTAPALVYAELARHYTEKVAWEKVVVALGDERCVPADHPDSNWRQAQAALLHYLPIPAEHLLQPDITLPAAKAAAQYQEALLQLPQAQPGIPRFNHLWLGMGEDGHTLSLFPDHPSSAVTLSGALVIPVYDSPKPPPERISLTLQALQGVETCLIMVSGAGKAAILSRALEGDTSLPIVQAVNTIEKHGGQITWLLDKAAAVKD